VAKRERGELVETRKGRIPNVRSVLTLVSGRKPNKVKNDCGHQGGKDGKRTAWWYAYDIHYFTRNGSNEKYK